MRGVVAMMLRRIGFDDILEAGNGGKRSTS
jgi:hypothetical protein